MFTNVLPTWSSKAGLKPALRLGCASERTNQRVNSLALAGDSWQNPGSRLNQTVLRDRWKYPPFAGFSVATGDFLSAGTADGSLGYGRLPKWPTGADCKSAGSRLLWFESRTYHHLFSVGKHWFSPLFSMAFPVWLVFIPCAFLLFPAFAFPSIKLLKVIQKSYKSYTRPRQGHASASRAHWTTPALPKRL